MPCDPQALADSAVCVEAKVPTGRIVPALIYLAAVRAGLSTDPAVLTAAANCIECGIPPGAQLAVLVSLATAISGDSNNPTSIEDQAKCVSCALPIGMEWPVMLALFCARAGSNCDPQTLSDNARCIDCGMMPGQQMPVLIYIFATLAAASTNPTTLMDNAKCILCGIAPGLWLPALISLTCDFFLSNNPAAPSNLLISPASTNGNNIMSWTASGPGPAPTSYQIWRSVNGGAYAQVGSVGGGVTTFTHVAAMPAADQWYYEVRACNADGCSAFTDPAGIFETFERKVNTGVVTYSFPFLQMVFQNIDISAQLATTTVSLPKLHTVNGYYGIYNNSALASLNQDSLVSVHGVLCQVSNNSPLTTINLPALTTVDGGYFNVQVSATLTTLNIPVLATVAGTFYCASCPLLTTLSAPALAGTIAALAGSQSGFTSFSMPNLTAVSGTFDLSFCSNLTSINIGSLSTVGGDFNINECAFSTLTLSSVTSIGQTFTGDTQVNLTSLSMPNLTSIGFSFLFNSCTNLVTVSMPNVIYTDGNTIDLDADALSAASVNEILARGVASGLTSEFIDLSGGTNAAPSGQGIVDKATLIGNGCTVNTN